MAERQAEKKAPGAIEISIHRARCKKCGYCVEFCPKKVLAMEGGVLAMEGGVPAVVRADLCNGCGLCEALCPDFAVKVVRKERKPDAR